MKKPALLTAFLLKNTKPIFTFLQVLFRPAFLYGEVTAPDGKGPVGNVLVYRCTARHKTVVAYFERCYEVGVAPDKAVFAYGCFVFGFTVVVDENNPTAYVGVFANGSVPYVGKMACFYPFVPTRCF